MEQKMTKKEAGRLGGLKTYQKYGADHMRSIGKRGYKATSSKYQVLPYRLSQWVMVHRETGEVKAIWS